MEIPEETLSGSVCASTVDVYTMQYNRVQRNIVQQSFVADFVERQITVSNNTG